MEIREIFENKVKIEPKVMSIEVLFNNPDRVKNTNYKPFYQRNYVWDDEKATYFIESILLGTEIPPLIYFKSKNRVEIIDGRQRYQTILRFIKNEFKLKKNGLQKINSNDIVNKNFKDLKNDIQNLFWDTKLRIIEFSFHSPNMIDEEMEDVVKKEIFKRYNSGITPLKPTEIDNAIYIDDDLNSFFKKQLNDDLILKSEISNVLRFEKPKNEIILKKIRQLLVQHKIPIKYYAVKKNIVISKFYEFSFSDITDIEIKNIYSRFIEKINLLTRIKSNFPDEEKNYNRLISECLFWVFSIMENENKPLSLITNEIITELVDYIEKNIDAFEMVRSSFAKELFKRYNVISIFFSNKFDIDFSIYLQNNQDFKAKNKQIIKENEDSINLDDIRIHKTEPSSIAIVDICRQMNRQRFLIRPPYQRNEVINKKKSSSIIESILLGIKLPPIFIYKREDEISEVLDGQQRLLSILGFINETYKDENNNIRYSDKNKYSLYLKNGILKNLHGKKFEQLTIEQQNKIKDFDLWIIEINHKNNNDFEPIDLFIRLNNKPYPIKEDTFEMWNSYVSREIILTIKSIYKNNRGWFYIRKNNSRMENENIYTALSYFQYTWNTSENKNNFIPKDVGIYKTVDRINFRVKSKNEITKTIENPTQKHNFISSANDFEFNFIKKLKILLSDGEDSPLTILNKNLDYIFNIGNGRRTQQAFYALWYFLFDVPLDLIDSNLKNKIREELRNLFRLMSGIESKEKFDIHILNFKNQFSNKPISKITKTRLENIATISSGINLDLKKQEKNKVTDYSFQYVKNNRFKNYRVNSEDLIDINNIDLIKNEEVFKDKSDILINKTFISNERFITSFSNSNLILNSNTIGVRINRYGFKTKYALAIISSKYSFNKAVSDNENKVKNLNLSLVKSLEIPVIPIEEQALFVKVVDYILDDNISPEATLFFERLIDAMTLELFNKEIFEKNNIKITEHLGELKETRNIETVNSIYKKLSAPNNILNSDLLRILRVEDNLV